jgi:hypothetical protein
MKTLNPKLILDPMWLCQANFIDLEYYSYVLLDAKQKYLKSLSSGDFSHFYEIAFNYFNLNTALADKKIYDSGLKPITTDSKLSEIVSQLTQPGESTGKEIVKEALSILSSVLKEYLAAQLGVMESLHFYFNNRNLHLQDKLYIVYKPKKVDQYEIYQLSLTSQKKLGHSVKLIESVYLPDLDKAEFTERLSLEAPSIKDFDPKKNVIVISGETWTSPIEAVSLVKDTILLNRIIRPSHGFDVNVLRDIERLLETKKSIPFKLKA